MKRSEYWERQSCVSNIGVGEDIKEVFLSEQQGSVELEFILYFICKGHLFIKYAIFASPSILKLSFNHHN